MSNSILLDKSKELTLEVIRLCNEIKTNKKESILTNQLVRSGTSVGTNIREAFYAHGKADFIARLHIALKECAESEYWLELLLKADILIRKLFWNIAWRVSPNNPAEIRQDFLYFVYDSLPIGRDFLSYLQSLAHRVRREGRK